jgi:hypothetical protein
MLYLFSGSDVKKRNEALERFSVSLSNNLETFSIGPSNFSAEQVESFSSGSGLVWGKSALFFDHILEKEETREFLFSRLENLASSENHFVFLEDTLLKGTLDSFKKARAEINVFELSKEKKEKFNNFLLANAFGDRNKVNLWINFRRAVDLGVGLEELVGVLFWKAKDMILKRNFSKFSAEELRGFATKISYLLPKVRREGRDAEAAFEEFLLEAF